MLLLRIAAFSIVLSLVPAVAEAASVRSVKKKTVVIDLEENETVEKGTEVCFFSEAGKKVGCGSVAKIKGTAAQVKLSSSKRAKKVKPGMEARIGGGSGGEAVTSQDSAGSKSVSSSKKMPFRIFGLLTPALATPATYKKIAYEAPTALPPDSLWAQDSDIKSAMLSFGVGVGIPLGANSINPGVRYRSFVPSVIDSDYVPNTENPYVSLEQKASALGFWVDYQFMRKALMPARLFLDLYGGIDVDMSTVTITATKKDDSGSATAQAETELASAESKLTVISLKAGTAMDFMLVKVLGARVGFNVLIPLVASGSFTSSVDDSKLPDDPDADLKEKLAHQKSTFALEAVIGMTLAF